MSLSKKCNVLFPLVINNSPMNRFPISKSTYVQISCAKYIPLLCQIWPDFIQKSSLFYQQSLGMIQTRVPNSQLYFFCRQSSIHSSANYIHCSIKLSVFISLFTVIHNSLSTLISFVQLTFCFEGRQLSKIRLGANVTWVTLLSFKVIQNSYGFFKQKHLLTNYNVS